MSITKCLATSQKSPYIIPTKWILSPFLQMRKLTLKKVKQSVKNHTKTKGLVFNRLVDHGLPTDQDDSISKL